MTFQPSPGADWPKMDAYLRSLGIRIDTPTLGETEGGGHVPGSEHYQHRARDYPTSSCDAPAVARALEPFAHGPHAVIDELFFSPLRIWYDSGAWFQPAAGAIEYRNHFSHCHAGIARGASLPTGNAPTPTPAPPKPPTPPPMEDEMKGHIIQCRADGQFGDPDKNRLGWFCALLDRGGPFKWHVGSDRLADAMFAHGHTNNARPEQVDESVFDAYTTV